jgi:sialate O-acetylesterase
MKRLSPILLIVWLVNLSAYADIKMPAMFCDNMVVQQQSEVAIWGWAKAKAAVRVTCSWNNKTYKVGSDENGKWKTLIQTPKAGFTAYFITISDGKSITINNVLAGEVWLCSGQSNMEMPMKGYKNQHIANGVEDIQNSTNNNIRLFTLKRNATTTPQEDSEGNWSIADPETVAEFSATAYYFGRKLFKTLNIPIGLINSSRGGSCIETWMTPDALKDFPNIKIPTVDETVSRIHTPTVLYNAMIYPIQGYGIKGAIWYQGEANVNNYKDYEQMFAKMIGEWRRLWSIGDFPFYYVQIAPYKRNGTNAAYLREAQMKSQQIPNTGMAVVMDADSPDCIHPPKKRDAGERLALWALAKDYGQKLPYKSPSVANVQIQGQVATLLFDGDKSTGLTTYGKEIKGFSVAGQNKRFYPAVASLNGNKVVVVSAMVDQPVSVRYAFDDTSGSEIFSVNGNLPVSSFRTDDW